MAGSVASFLLTQAWNLLWKPDTPYYLPVVLVDGASGDGKTVPPLGNRPVPDLGPYGLFGDSTFGEINLSLTDGSVGGLGTASNGGFTYDDATEVFTATIKWAGLTYDGRYAVTGNGLLGCAAAGAGSLMKIIPGLHAEAGVDATVGAPVGAPVGDDEDQRLQQAREYRDKLVQSPAGLELVGQYYDNNWAMNEVVRGENVFTAYMNQKRDVSAGMADQTSAAAAAPDDPDRKVGNTIYYANSMTRQVVFERACQNASGADDDPFADAAAATNSFATVVTGDYDGPVTVGHVMTQVADAPAGQLRARMATGRARYTGMTLGSGAPAADAFRSDEIREAYRAGREEAEAFIRDYEAGGGPHRTFSELLLAGQMPVGSGTFDDTFAAPDVVVSGTVTVTGDPSNPQLTMTLTRMTANLPSIDIGLSSGDGWDHPSLYDKVTQALANVGFVHDLIRSKIGDKLGDEEVLSYLSGRINDAINKALGDF